MRCRMRPSFIHNRLSGCSDDGHESAAIKNSTEAANVHGHTRPRCQLLSRLTSANAPAMTRPNVRSDPGCAASSRVKLSWVDCFMRTADKTPSDIRRALSGVRGEVAGFFGLFRPGSDSPEHQW